MTRTDDLLDSIRSAAPELLPHAEAVFARKPPRSMAKAGKAGKRLALKKDVEELLHVVRSLKGGTQEDAWRAAVQASELQERLGRTNPPDPTEASAKMPTPEGRVSLSSYLNGIVRDLRGTPPRRPDPFRLAPVGQLRKAPAVDSQALEKGMLRVMERRRKRREGVLKKSNRGTPSERVEASEALEKNLLRQLREQQGRRRDLFGRPTG